jgi:PIN domain nuclease of toxin-antitoxin system
MLNLDTHIVVHMFSGTLTTSEQALLEHEPLGISSIVFWEIGRLRELGRISVGLEHAGFCRLLSELHVWEISPEVCRAMVQDLDFESDPADELIAATSIAHRVPLVTRDEKILGSKAVPFPKRRKQMRT